MYSNFMFLDQFLFELSCKKHTQTHTQTQIDSEEYSDTRRGCQQSDILEYTALKIKTKV